MATLIALQMRSSPHVQDNLEYVEQQLQGLNVSGPSLVVLPECFALFGAGDKAQRQIAEIPEDGPIQSQLSRLARQYGVWLLAGTLPLASPDPDRFHAASLLFDSNGNTVAQYNKIHLFDVQVADSTGAYRESNSTEAGQEVVVADTPFGRVGLSVCYDLRFSGLYQAMGPVDVLVVPAAFTRVTGEAHWMPLLQSRAIEYQCYVVAAGQWGVHANGRETHGHSAIVSPWGEVKAQLASGQGMIEAQLEVDELARIRAQMPVRAHNKFRSQIR